MTWDLKRLRDDVEALYGREQRWKLAPCLESIIDRKFFARMQYQAAKRLLDEFMADRDTEQDMVDLAFGLNRDVRNEFHFTNKRAEGHIVACLESLHALADTLGHVIYFGLGMDLEEQTAIAEDRIYLGSVVQRLPQAAADERLVELVQEMRRAEDFEYISAVANHSKHRSWIGAPYTFRMDGNDSPPHGLQFKGFTYRGKMYPAQWVAEVMTREYDRRAKLIIEAGEALNEAVASRLAARGH